MIDNWSDYRKPSIDSGSTPSVSQPPNIAELWKLLAEATPGPWKYEPGDWDEEDNDGNPLQTTGAGMDGVFTVDCGDYFGLSDANAQLIVAAVNALPGLLDDNEFLKSILDANQAENYLLQERIEKLEAALRALLGIHGCSCPICRIAHETLAKEPAE